MPSDQVAQFRPDLTRAFLSHWTSRLTPHLRNVLAFLERVYEFGTELFEYKYIRFVDIYSMMIHEVGHIMKGMPESSLQEEIYHCEDKYRRYSSIFSHHKDDIITPMPSFEQLWRSFAILSNILLLRTAVGLIPALAKWCMAGSFVVGYQAHSDDRGEAARVRGSAIEFPRRRRTGHSVRLKNALEPFALDRDTFDKAICSVLYYFSCLLTLVMDTFVFASYTPSPTQTNVLQDECVRICISLKDDFFDGASLLVCMHVCTVNVRTIVETLVLRYRELLQHHSSDTVGWYLHAWSVDSAATILVQAGADHDAIANSTLIATERNFDPRLDMRSLTPRINYI